MLRKPVELISFFIPGKAAPGGSKRGFIRGNRVNIVDACKANPAWKKYVKKVGKRKYNGQPQLGALKVVAKFIRLRPKSHYRQGKFSHLLKPSAPLYPTTKPDTTKLFRAVEDALTGVLWKDDALIVDQVVRKRYGNKQGVRIKLMLMPTRKENKNARSSNTNSRSGSGERRRR